MVSAGNEASSKPAARGAAVRRAASISSAVKVQHPEAMPILRRPVEPAESPARLQLHEPSYAFLGTQELGEDVPVLPLDVGAEWPGDFREREREAVLGSVARGSPGFAQARRSNT